MIRTIPILSLLSLLFLFSFAQGESQKKFPSVEIMTLDRTTINTADFDNEGRPIVISFWATWCKPCIIELSNIAGVYEDWQEETGVKLIAISIDDPRQASMVQPLIKKKGWEYEVYLDLDGELKRALNVVNVPHTFLLDGAKNIVFQHNSYAPGDEKDLYNRILELVD